MAGQLSDRDIDAYLRSPNAHPSVAYSVSELAREMRARRTNVDEGGAELRSRGSAPAAAAAPARTVVVRRESVGGRQNAEAYVEDVFEELGLHVRHVSTVEMRNGGTLWRMSGQCPIHGVVHSSNHWVLMNSPGYNTTRVQCMSDMSIREVHRLPID